MAHDVPQGFRDHFEAALGVQVDAVPFSGEAFHVHDPEERGLGNLWDHQAGDYLVQDAASLLPVEALDPRPGERVLDLCAAPGGKTTHIAARMEQRGLVVANEARLGRLGMLGTNLDRLGSLNVAVTHADGLQARWPFAFDRVLVDAPCTNLGKVHATHRPAMSWSLKASRAMARRQRNLLARAYDATREGGTIVYSTCTLDPAENEEVADWFLRHHDVTVDPYTSSVGREGLTETPAGSLHPDVAGTRRVHPGDADVDGFFVARFIKTGPTGRPGKASGTSDFELAPPATLEDVLTTYELDAPALQGATVTRTRRRLYVTTAPDVDELLAMGAIRVGTYLATDEGGDYRLSLDAATSYGAHAGNVVDLPADEALTWMNGGDVPAPRGAPWTVLRLDGEGIGASRAYGDRFQNFVPKERRLPAADARLVGALAAPDT